MAAPVVSTLGTVLASGTRVNSDVPVPASVAAGDVIEVLLYLETVTAPTPPAGFTEITFSPNPTTTGNVSYQRRYWKRATGADSGNYTFTHASTWTTARAIRITGCVATGTPLEVLGSATRSSNGTASPAVTGTTLGSDRLLSAGYTDFSGGSWTAPTGFSGGGSHNELGFSYKTQAVAGTTGSVSATSSTTGYQTTTLVGYLPVAGGGDTTAPTVPTGLTATATSSSAISLSWTASTDNVAVTGYTVKRGGSTIATGVTGTSYGDSGLSAATLYSYTVSAQDAAGNSSADSSAATATTLAASSGPALVVGTLDPRMYELLRGPHFAYGYVEAWRGGSAVEVEIDGQLTTRLPLVDGSVEVDGSTPGVRRTLSASFAPLPSLFDALAPTGTELRAFLVTRGPDGVEQVDAQGVFAIDSQRKASSGDIRITAPDRWKRVMDGRFLVPRASNAGATVRAQIAALLDEVMPAGVTTVDLSTSTATVPAQVWDRDRDKAIEELAKAASLDVFMDRSGVPTIRDAPTIDPENVAWTVDSGALGVMVSAERERSRQRTYNLVVVNGTPNDGVAPFPTQFVWDNDPNSGTFAGPGGGAGGIEAVPDPSLAGPFGQRPTYYSSPLLRDISQALVAGYTILERVSGLASQLTLTTAPKADLDDGATILVKLPPEYPRGPIPLELHIVDRMTVPLRPSKGDAMGISTRSTLVGYEGAE